jgi:ABC-type transporter Mla MlaB component
LGCKSLEFFDSSALSAILSMKRHAQQKNISIVLEAIPEKLASLAKVYGVADVVLV